MESLIKNFELREEEIVFESFFKFPEFANRLTGFGSLTLDANSSLRKKISHYVKVSYHRLSLIGFLFGTFSMIGYAIDHRSVLKEAAGCIPNITTIMLIGLKAFTTYNSRDELRNIVQEISGVFNKRLDTKHKMKTYLDQYQFYMRIYAMVFILILFPVYYPVVDYVLYQKTQLSVQYWFPINVFRLQTFPLALFWTDWMGWIMTTNLLATDTTIYAIITVVSMEFDVLTSDLRNFSLTVRHERMKKLKSFVDRHNKLLDLSDKLQDIYGWSFLFSFVGSSIIICFITFHLSIAGTFYEYMLNIPYLMMMGGQIFLLCFFGQKLVDAGESVIEGVYWSGWESFHDLKLEKQLIVIMARAQKPKKLSALGFADISLTSFTSVRF